MCTARLAHVMLAPGEMKWAAAPPALPAGVKLAIIEGDPREVGPFTMRFLFPAGTRVEPHFHPGIEHATVLSGLVSFGVGRRFAVENLMLMPVGIFIVIPAELPHFGLVEEDTLIQAHGIGPWQTTYINERP